MTHINDALARGETIVFGADCEIEYSGRAETFLPRGERLIIIKSDKTLLIHQPQGSNPINYMKENSVHQLILDQEQNKLLLKSQNSALKEYIDMVIHTIHFMHSGKLQDGQKLQLSGNERDMADMIAADLSVIEEGMRLVNKEEQTTYGFIDVFAFDKDYNLVVIECKRYRGDFKAVSQLRRYVEKIKEAKGIQNVRGILACPSITPNALKMLSDFGFEHKEVKPPKQYDRFSKDQKGIMDFV